MQTHILYISYSEWSETCRHYIETLFITGLEYTIRKTQENQGEMKLNVTRQLLACTDDVQLRDKNMLTFKKAQRFY
jgi:hypothetical protein